MFGTKEGAQSLHISVKNHDTHSEEGKFIYNVLPLSGKQLLLKHDRSRIHKNAV